MYSSCNRITEQHCERFHWEDWLCSPIRTCCVWIPVLSLVQLFWDCLSLL
jgi:hypothetical protein